MSVMLNSRVSAVILSRGSTWSPQPWEPPYLLPDVGAAWPTGTVSCVFYDTAGTTLATVSGTVAATGITFTAAPAVMDAIPAGANFEIFLTTSGAPYQIRYGKVLRREAQFMTSSGQVTTPLAFTDSWPTLGIRSTWQMISGSIQVQDNTDIGQQNAIGGASGAMRWYKPLSGDTAQVKISTINRFSYHASASAKMRVILAANTALSSYLAVEFHASADGAGVHSDQIHFCTGTDPVTVSYQGSPLTSVVANADSYTVRYDDTTKTLSVYKGTSTSPLGSWVDVTNIVPHGPGYRYLGVAFVTSPPGWGVLEASSWTAMDSI